MRALARWCFTHKLVVLGVWIAALIALGGLNAAAGSGYTDSFSLPGTESTTALNLLTDNFDTESTDTNQVVFGSADVDAVSGATYTSASYTQSLQSALDKLGFKAADGSVATLQVP